MYALPQRQEQQYTPTEFGAFIDPTLIRAARQLYRVYHEFYSEIQQPPSGVVIHRFTYRGKLVYSSRPVLLPEECFVPLSQIQAEVY